MYLFVLHFTITYPILHILTQYYLCGRQLFSTRSRALLQELVYREQIMGCGPSFESNRKIAGQGNEVYETAQVFGLTQHDLDVLYRYFNKCNISHTGRLSIAEFIVVSGIDRTEGMAIFGEIIFRLFDETNDRRLTFHELILALYFFLTQERDLLELFAFQLFVTFASEFRAFHSQVLGRYCQKGSKEDNHLPNNPISIIIGENFGNSYF